MTLATLGVSGSPGTHKPYVPMIPKWPHIRQYSDFDKPDHLSREEWGVECAKALETAIHYEGEQTVAAFIATLMVPGRITVSCRPRVTGRRFGKFAIDTMSCSLPMRSCLGLREQASGLRWNTLASPPIL